MLTLLPYPDYEKTAKVFSDVMLEQQINNVNIIMTTLHQVEEVSGWNNTPAILMWCNYEPQLCMLGIALCREYKSRMNMDHTLETRIEWHLTCATGGSFTMRKPPWSGDKTLHESHQSEMIRLNEGYIHIFTVPSDLPLIWPELTSDG